MKMNLLTELICNVLLYSIGFGGLMVVCAVAEGQLSLLPALAIGPCCASPLTQLLGYALPCAIPIRKNGA